MTPRRAATLAVHLPFGAASWIAAGSDAAWSTEAHLLASVIDVLRMANWQRGGDAKAPQPELLLRPSGAAEKDAQLDRHAARAHAFRERQKRRREEQATSESKEG